MKAESRSLFAGHVPVAAHLPHGVEHLIRSCPTRTVAKTPFPSGFHHHCVVLPTM